MHPILLETRWFTIHTYGLTAAIGFAAAFLYAGWEARRQGRDPQQFVDLTFYMILCGIAGARLLYVIVNIDDFASDPLGVFRIWEGGLVFYGGLLLASAVGIAYMYKKKIPVWLGTDVLYPATILGLGIGRIGCLMAGCCYGKICTLPWAITYPLGHPTNPYPNQFQNSPPEILTVHPTPVYAFLSCMFMWFVSVQINRRKSFHGQTSGVLLIMYAVYRYLIEFVRGDFERGWLIENVMSTSQFISLPIIAFGVFLLVSQRKKRIPEEERVPTIEARRVAEAEEEAEKARAEAEKAAEKERRREEKKKRKAEKRAGDAPK